MFKAVDELRFVTETLAGLRFAGLDQNPKGVRDILGSTALRIADAVREFDRAMADIGGCGDGYCSVTGKAKGQHTNGGCRCSGNKMTAQRAMQAARRLRESLAE